MYPYSSTKTIEKLNFFWSKFVSLLKWVAFGAVWKVKILVTQSCLTLWNPMTVAHQAPLSMEFSRQKYWNGLPFLSPGDLPNPGIEPRSCALQADSFTSWATIEAQLTAKDNFNSI